jgi:hypothetical protein
MSNNNQIEQIKQFLYREICERRPYSASRMCEEVIKFIEQMNTGENNGEITTVNNIPDTNTNTSTTGNISAIWGGDTSSNTLYDSNTWRSWQKSIAENNRIAEEKKIWDGTTMAEYINKIEAEKQIWDKTVNWDVMNKHTRVRDEEQALYNKTIVLKDGAMKTIRVSKPDKMNDGTLAVIEITVKVKQQ